MTCMGQSQAGNRNNELLASAMHRAETTAAAAFHGKEAVEGAETFRSEIPETDASMGRLSDLDAAAFLAATLRERPVHPTNILNANAWKLSSEWSGATEAAPVRKY